MWREVYKGRCGRMYFPKMAATKSCITLALLQWDHFTPSSIGGVYFSTHESEESWWLLWPVEQGVSDTTPVICVDISWPSSFIFLPLGRWLPCRKRDSPESTMLCEAPAPLSQWRGPGCSAVARVRQVRYPGCKIPGGTALRCPCMTLTGSTSLHFVLGELHS